MPQCNISTAPINISSGVNTPCTTGCSFTYDYGDSGSPSVTNQTTYLDITCWSDSNVILGGDIMSKNARVNSVRLYAPSLNTFNGHKADAELIITHGLENSSNVYVCIPVISSEKNGSSAKWFHKIIPFSPTLKISSKQIINATNISLNHLIPEAPYCVYEGGSFDWGCNKNDKMIIFEKNVAINMKSDDYVTLRSLINKASYNISQPDTDLLFVKNGTKHTANRPGGKRTMTCKPITFPDGSPIINTDTSKLLPYENTSDSGDKESDKDGVPPIWYILVVIFGALSTFLLIVLICLVAKSPLPFGLSGKSNNRGST
jgi:hypothetical protein